MGERQTDILTERQTDSEAETGGDWYKNKDRRAGRHSETNRERETEAKNEKQSKTKSETDGWLVGWLLLNVPATG